MKSLEKVKPALTRLLVWQQEYDKAEDKGDFGNFIREVCEHIGKEPDISVVEILLEYARDGIEETDD